MAPFDDFSFSPVTVAAPATPVQLPHIPSALIRLALADLEKVERTPGYRVDMGAWHEPEEGGCAVCLAGSVMAMSLSARPDEDLHPFEMGDHNKLALRALNSLRCAELPSYMESACANIGAQAIEWSRQIPNYSDDRPGFHAAMHALANEFEASGQ